MLFSYNFNKKTKFDVSPRLRLRASRTVFSLLMALLAAIGTYLIVRAAPSIVATMTDAFIGGDGDGKADPGETIEYTTVLQNSGADPATGVSFSDVIDINTTLVNGSLNVSPLAGDDSYATIGNTLLEVGVTASGSPAVSVTSAAIDSLFDNDTEFLGDTFTLLSVESDTTAPFTTTTEQGGSVTVETDGNFSYTPPVGFTGADNFDYVITDDGAVGSSALTGAGRVTINVNAQEVWYVNNDSAAGGPGRSSDPFDTLLEAQTASGTNDIIYVAYAGGDLTGQNAGILLKDGQRLIGEGVALEVAVSLTQQGISGPNPTPLTAAGSQPRIGNTGGDGVSAADDMPAEIRGLSLSGSNNAIDITITDASAGTLQIKDNTIFGAGAEGIDINHNGSATLTLDAQNNIWNTGGTHTGNAFDASANGTGRLALNFSSNTNILSTGASGVVVADTGGTGTLVVTGFSNNSVHQNTSLNGISANTVIFDATAGGTFQVVSGGGTTIGVSGDGVGGGGLLLTTVSGNLSFTDLDIVASNGTGVSATGSTPYTGSAGFQIAVGSGATISATNGPAVNLNTVAASLPFSDIDSASSASTGVSLAAVTGSFSAGSGSTISNATSTDFVVSNSTATITYSGSINDSAGAGVSLTTNTGSTITVNGPLTISSGASTAFSATGGGTVNVCDDNPCNSAATGSIVNTLTSTTGTAINVVSTNIGANNLEFKSISSSGGTAPGIILDTTGSSGGLKVVGDGTNTSVGGNSTGGIISNKSGSDGSTSQGIGIYLNNTSNVVLRRMTINGTNQNFGIRGVNTTNVTIEYSTISGTNGDSAALDEGSVNFDNWLGTGAITSSIIEGGFEDNLNIVNTSGTLNRLVITGSTFGFNNTVNGNNNILIESQNAGTTLNFTLQSSTIKGARADWLNASANSSSTMDAIVDGNTFDNLGMNAHPGAAAGGNRVVFGAVGTLTVDVRNNTMKGSKGEAVRVRSTATGALTGTVDARVRNNVIGVAATANSGSAESSGIFIFVDGGGDADVAITNNQIFQYNNHGILLQDGDEINDGSVFNATVTGNTVNSPGNINTDFNGIHLNNGTVGATDNFTSCVDIGGAGVLANDIVGSGNGTVSPNNQEFRLRQRQSTTVRLPGYGGANNNDAAVVAYIQGRNTVTGGNGAASNTVPTGGGFIGGAACTQPSFAFGPDNNQTLAQNQTESDLAGLAQASNTELNPANTLAVASASMNPSEQVSAVAPANTVVNASTNLGGGKPLFRFTQPMPAQSGETVSVPAFTLPAGKSVTIKFQVTVNSPSLPLGTTKITNQGTISGSNFSNVLTTNGGPADCETGSETCTPVDRPDANVNSINRQTPSTTSTNATLVVWRVTFDTPISGLTSSNFTLANTGLTSPSITTVSAVTGAPDTQWDVTVNTGTGDGTLGLNMTNDTGLSHDVFTLTFTGQTYTIDRTAPTVSSIARKPGSGNPTNADILGFRVTFSEPVTSVGASNFDATGTTSDLNNSLTTNITPNLVFEFFVDGTAGGDLPSLNGTVGLDVTPTTITDLAGNALVDAEPPAPASTNDQTYTVDNAAPTVTINQAVGQNDPTNANPIVFTAVFSEAVTDFDDLSDVTLGGTASATVTSISGGPTTYTVNVTATTEGTVTATVPVNRAQDSVGNNNAASTSTDNTVTYDTTAPTVSIDQAAGQADPTNVNPIVFTVVFNEPVTDFDDLNDVSLSGTASATVTSISGGPTTYTVNVTVTVDGTVIATVPVNKAQDLAGNNNASSTSTDNTVLYDTVAPNVTINQAAGQTDPTDSGSINFTVTFNDAVPGFATGDVNLSASTAPGTLTGTVTEIVPNDGTTYNVAVSGMTGDGFVVASINAGVATDGLNTNAASTSTDNSVLYDTAAPSVTINQAAGQADPTNASQINFTVVFSEAVTDFDDLGDVSLTGTASATLGSIMGGPTTYTAVVNVTTEGTVIASIPAGAALDAALQANGASTSTDNTVTYDATAPTVIINQAAGQADPTNSSPINFTVVFSEAVTDFDDAADVTLSGTAGATTVNITGGPTTYIVEVSGMTNGGTVIAGIPASAAQDLAGNSSAASTSTDNTVTFTVNTTTTITSDNPDPSTVGQAVTVNFTVTAAVGPNPNTGNVTVTDSGGATPCVGAVTAGAGSCNITLTTSGPHTLTATYSGSGTFNGSQDTEPHNVSITMAVNTFTDELNADGDCSLREAVRAANTNLAVDACPAGSASTVDIITLATGTYSLTLGGTDNAAASGDLDITGDTRITGAGAASTFISGLNLPSPGDRIFHIVSGAVQIESLTIKNGKNAVGAGVYNAGTLTLNSVTVSDNVATTGASGSSSGAGIYSTGTLTLNNSTVSNNLATSGYKGASLGGGIHNNGATVTLNSSTVTGNRAISGIQGTSRGGGIYTSGGSTTLNSTTPSGNTVTTGSGGIAQGPNTYP